MKTKFREYKTLDLNEISNEISKFWKENSVFEQSISSKNGKENYVFYEGPPSANGMPGIHHLIARSIKDIFCRYHSMLGKKVIRKAGWDTHGLPVELGVEKQLGITKEDIGEGKKISIEQYNAECKKAVMRYTEAWNELTEKIGYWVDLKNPYITYESKYIESVWWLLEQLYKKDLLYKGYTIQPYSPKAGTGLSTHELNMPGCYKEVSDTSIVAQFEVHKNSTKLFDSIDEDVYFLAWTTTPWTLPSNTALSVGKQINYVVVKTYNQYTFKPICVVLAKDLLAKQFPSKKFIEVDQSAISNFESSQKLLPYCILFEAKGEELIGIRYKQLLPWVTDFNKHEDAFVVIAADFVTTSDGTGIVHTAPTFGADDFKAAKQNNVPSLLVPNEHGKQVPLVNLQGKFLDSLPNEFAGKYVKNEYYEPGKEPDRSVDVEIAILLKQENKAFNVEKHIHSYPHCWRTDKPILYYPLDSWFIKVNQCRERLLELNKQINWKPASTGEKRFGNWLENVSDWNLSRSRYWGIPLPIWRTKQADEELIIGSIQQLSKEIDHSIEKGFMHKNPLENFKVGDFSTENYNSLDLHKNFVDTIILCSPNGKPMYRESDLIDVWFDSGSMPYAQLHYPFENKDLIDENKMYPADFIAEGVDQTRGWFYTLHAISGLVFDQVSYKNVISNGLVLDKYGNKMSKSKGNTLDPFEILNHYGADATRWYMISNAQPWDNLRFDVSGIDEVKRKFFGTLYNVYSFFALYANYDGFSYKEDEIEFSQKDSFDRWILSELNVLVKKVNNFLSDYDPTKAIREIQNFVVDDLSNWYVRLSRRKFWKGDYSKEKISAYQTLYECLNVVSKLIAPFIPFYADRIFKDLNDVTSKEHAQSVHLSDFPIANPEQVDLDLICQTKLAQEITSLVLSIRKKEKIKVRQPLKKILIPVSNSQREKIELVADLIKQEVNIKEIEFIDPSETSSILVKMVKPNFKALGPILGKEISKVKQALEALTAKQIKMLETNKMLNVLGFDLPIDHLEIQTKDVEGWSVASSSGLTVALDITIDQPLFLEGIARELVNRIQNLRKDQNLNIIDKISLTIQSNEQIKQAILENYNYVCNETLTNSILFDAEIPEDKAQEVEVNHQKIKLLLNKIT